MQNLTPTARRMKAIRDLRAAKTPLRKKRKKEKEKIRRLIEIIIL